MYFSSITNMDVMYMYRGYMYVQAYTRDTCSNHLPEIRIFCALFFYYVTLEYAPFRVE